MKIVKHIHFDREERRALQEVVQSIGILRREPGYEDMAGDEIERALSGMANGNETTEERIKVALCGLIAMGEACERQADLPYWREQMSAPRPPQERLNDHGHHTLGGIPMILDPERMAEVLATAREVQFQWVLDAKALLQSALRVLNDEVPA